MLINFHAGEYECVFLIAALVVGIASNKNPTELIMVLIKGCVTNGNE